MRAAPRSVVARPARPALKPDDPRIADGHAVLQRFWSGIGQPDPALLTTGTAPELSGPLSWPGLREAYRVVRREGGLILATDGLSDPFVGKNIEDESGFGVELFLDLPGAQDMSRENIRASWAFELLTITARNVAGFGGIVDRLDRQGTAPMAMALERNPGEGWSDAAGYVGILIGLPARGIARTLPLPFGAVRIVPVTLLRADEAGIAARGEHQRRDIAAALIAAGHGHRSDLTRPSVL